MPIIIIAVGTKNCMYNKPSGISPINDPYKILCQIGKTPVLRAATRIILIKHTNTEDFCLFNFDMFIYNKYIGKTNKLIKG